MLTYTGERAETVLAEQIRDVIQKLLDWAEDDEKQVREYAKKVREAERKQDWNTREFWAWKAYEYEQLAFRTRFIADMLQYRLKHAKVS